MHRIALTAALIAAACARSHPPTTPPLCFEIEHGIPALAPRTDASKLDPQLRNLLALRQAERVDVTIEFRGELSDLEAIGFVKDSLVAHPTAGYKIATGTLPIDALQAVSQIEHVVVVDAPVPLGPAASARR